MSTMESGHTNISLLPHENNVIIKDITQKISCINLMKDLLHKFQQATLFFEEKSLSRFDAQVGETLCQIRAYKIYYLTAFASQKFLTSLIETKDQISFAIGKLTTEAENYQVFLKMHKSQRPDSVRAPMTLTSFFTSMGCAFSISEDALFIYIAYFLCQYHLLDEDNIPMAIDYSAIANDLSVSRSYSKKLGHFYQKKLSELSCNFIFELLHELPGKEDLKAILPFLHRQSDEGRMVLPCYSVTEIIVLHMIENNANLIFLVDMESEHTKQRETIFLKGSRSQNNFKLVSKQNIIDAPCMVMYGSARVTKGSFHKTILPEMISTGFKELILFNNAAHPQYSGITLNAFSYNPFDTLIEECENQFLTIDKETLKNLSCNLKRLKQMAETIGCSINNQTLFLLKHIFCNIVNAYHEINPIDLKLPISPEINRNTFAHVYT